MLLEAGWAKCGLCRHAAWGTHLLTVKSLVWFLGDSVSSSVRRGWRYVPADTFGGLTDRTRGQVGFCAGFLCYSMSSLEQDVFGNVRSSIISVSLRLCEVCGCIVTLRLLTISVLILRRYTVSECIKMEKGNRGGHKPWPQRGLGWQE